MATGFRELGVNGATRFAFTGTPIGRLLTVNRATAQRNRLGREVHNGSVERNHFSREVREVPPNIMTGTNRRIDILTGRPID
jgi:hypothetical protein